MERSYGLDSWVCLNSSRSQKSELGGVIHAIIARLFHCIETLDKKATPLDTKIFHSNGPNYDPSNTSVLVDGPFCTDRFDTVPALSTYSFYNVYWY